MNPKFRAWLKEEKRMTDVNEMTFIDGEVYLISDVTDFYAYEEFKLMQSTSLFDKNGMEIYEGDIVKFSDCDDDVYITPVVWDKNYACFGVSFSGGYPISFDYLEEFYTELKDIEVVGDIYENPELLEGE
ncbi:hypothetical protein Si071_01426 [Streptococcus infantarius subsp. infantarius]|nr:hypothetical protein [Streptococcus infantarius subsp. infantarius]